MRKNWTAIVITMFWVAMMATLLIRDIIPERRRARSLLLDPEILAGQWSDIREYYWLRQEGNTLGAMLLLVEQNPVETGSEGLRGYRAIQNGEATIPIAFFRQQFHYRIHVDLSPEFHVTRYAAEVNLGLIPVEMVGFVRGRRLYYRVTAINAPPIIGSLPLSQPLSLLSAVRPMLTRQFDLEVGQRYPINVLDPINSLISGSATVHVAAEEKIMLGGEETDAFRIETTLGDITRNTWVSPRGETLRQELFRDILLERGDRMEVTQTYPAIRESLEMPDYDEEAIIAAADEGPAEPLGISPEMMRLLGQVLGGN